MELGIRTIEGHTGTAVVSFDTDHLDAGNVKEFRAAVQKIAEAHHVLLLDMSRLAFVDSSGLGALLSCLRTMYGKRGQLHLIGMTKPVRALLELVRMHRVFSIHDSAEEALGERKAA